MKNIINYIFLWLAASILLGCSHKNPKNKQLIQNSEMTSKISHKIATVNAIDIFYREAGDPNKPTILLLHGLPSSSHMFRNVMTSLADEYHLIAPDYPGFGFSEAPTIDEFEYSFDHISILMEGFIDQMELTSFYLLMQDYGGPIGMRIATKRPEAIEGLIIQNANAYMEGLGEWSQKIGGFVQSEDFEGLMDYKNYLFSPEGIKAQYTTGAKNPKAIDPVSYLTDSAFMQREGINTVQTALFMDYGNNFPKYPEWQQYLKEKQPPTLILWGENDKFFRKEGALAYRKDLKNASIHLFESGHFMLEEYATEAVALIRNFIQ
ncbi:alpha/beta fold hydrolase [Spongiimicrobium salis]|uniref:alpha/beta fold hydrolase n=1 Tax=Spongiimicrobium salis TaxID=1667022 RepID=UPI00374D622F